MKSDVAIKPGSTVSVTVSLEPSEVGKYFEAAVSQLATQHTFKGFREGKAPRGVVEQKLGVEAVRHQALELALSDGYYQAVTEHKLRPIGRPETDLAETKLDELETTGLKFTATVPVVPEVTIGDYQKVKVKPTPPEFKESDVDETLEQLRRSRANFVTVKRAARAGDRVEIDFVGTLNKKEFEGGKSERHPLIIGEDNFIPGFSDQLVGMSDGQVKEFEIPFPKDYHQPTLAGKQVTFTVTMHEIQERQLPELNEEFAKGFGANSLDDLKQRLSENLRQEREQDAKHRTEGEVVQAVVDTATVELPEALVDEEYERMIAELRANTERQGIPFDKYLEQLGKSVEDLKTEQRPEAERRVKTSLVLNELQQRENIVPDEALVDAEIQQQLSQAPDEAAKQQIQGDEFRQYVRRVLGNRLVVAKLVEYATA